jgi:hypothetical protein
MERKDLAGPSTEDVMRGSQVNLYYQQIGRCEAERPRSRRVGIRGQRGITSSTLADDDEFIL